MSYKWYAEYEIDFNEENLIVGQIMLEIDSPALSIHDLQTLFDAISEKELCYVSEISLTGITKIYQH